MKLTSLFALCITLVTLAQKPTLEPQKDWSKERTQLWLDSLVKSLSQDTKILGNTTQNLSEQPPARTPEQEAADAEFKRISEMPPNYTIDGIPHYIPESDKKATEWAKKKTLFESQKYERAAKIIKDAEFIFEGFNIPIDNNIYFSKKTNKYYYAHVVFINKIYRGVGLKEGFITILQPILGNVHIGSKKFNLASNGNYFIFCKKSSLPIYQHSYKFENSQQVEIINIGSGAEFDYKGVNLFNDFQFQNRDSLYTFLNKYINIKNVDNSLDRNIENYSKSHFNIESLINEKKGLGKNPFKHGRPVNFNFRTESTQSLAFDILPNVIFAGTNEILTISGSGFGNTILGFGNVVSFPGQVRFKNADIGGKENFGNITGKGYLLGVGLNNYIKWTDTQIILKIPSWVSGNLGIDNTFRNTPGTGLVKIKLNNGTELTIINDLYKFV